MQLWGHAAAIRAARNIPDYSEGPTMPNTPLGRRTPYGLGERRRLIRSGRRDGSVGERVGIQERERIGAVIGELPAIPNPRLTQSHSLTMADPFVWTWA